MSRWLVFLALLTAGLPPGAAASEFKTVVPMAQQGAAAYYVDGTIKGYGATPLMVDTGSGYTVIGQDTLDAMRAKGRASYVKKLHGTLADGTDVIVPVYRIDEMNIGGNCLVRDVEAAVFPNARYPILGMSVLSRLSPFMFSVNPPEITLSHCGGVTVADNRDPPAGDGPAVNASMASPAEAR